MKTDLLDSKDFWAGVTLIATGALTLYLAQNYQFGTAFRMGPGYFPKVLGAVLIGFGIYILAAAMRGNSEKLQGSWPLRGLIIIPLSLVLFGVLIDNGGFVPAMFVLIFLSATATPEFKFVEALLFSIFLTALSVAVFIYGLALPYPLFTFI
jgi:hypothetical protein